MRTHAVFRTPRSTTGRRRDARPENRTRALRVRGHQSGECVSDMGTRPGAPPETTTLAATITCVDFVISDDASIKPILHRVLLQHVVDALGDQRSALFWNACSIAALH